MNFPTEINGRKFENYIDWIAPAFLVTLVSLPAGSVPAGMTADGLPVGLQIVAPRFEEPLILSVAKLVQETNPIGWPPTMSRPVAAGELGSRDRSDPSHVRTLRCRRDRGGLGTWRPVSRR